MPWIGHAGESASSSESSELVSAALSWVCAVDAVCLFIPRPGKCIVMRGWGVGGDTGPLVTPWVSPRTVGRARAHWRHCQPNAVVKYGLEP